MITFPPAYCYTYFSTLEQNNDATSITLFCGNIKSRDVQKYVIYFSYSRRETIRLRQSLLK